MDRLIALDVLKGLMQHPLKIVVRQVADGQVGVGEVGHDVSSSDVYGYVAVLRVKYQCVGLSGRRSVKLVLNIGYKRLQVTIELVLFTKEHYFLVGI